jgi:hypothetical protein
MSDLPLGRIDVVPPHEHIPPDEAAVCRLANIARIANRQGEREFHVWSEQQIDDWTVAWGVPRTVAEAMLNFQQIEEAACHHIGMINLGDLARWVQEYATKRFRDGEMAERERYQEQGE